MSSLALSGSGNNPLESSVQELMSDDRIRKLGEIFSKIERPRFKLSTWEPVPNAQALHESFDDNSAEAGNLASDIAALAKRFLD